MLVLSSRNDVRRAAGKAEFLIPLPDSFERGLDGTWLVHLDAAVVPLNNRSADRATLLPDFSPVLLLSSALSPGRSPLGASCSPVVAVLHPTPELPVLSLDTDSRPVSCLPDATKDCWQRKGAVDLKLADSNGETLTGEVLDLTKEFFFSFRLTRYDG